VFLAFKIIDIRVGKIKKKLKNTKFNKHIVPIFKRDVMSHRFHLCLIIKVKLIISDP